ncbi:MAG: hypothetical protein LUF27_14940 [Lachnospiraceae bacterium]|nr:hypothetical protein [Lachnospiraceae bacterium]
MVDYKSFHFKEYRIMLPDGESEKVSRVECFRNGDMPTEDNPFKQRWFFSPDQGLAIRLPRNELGEKWYRYNDTELRAVCRRLEKENACLAQKTKVKCPIRCEDCKFYDACESKERANKGFGFADHRNRERYVL